MSDTVECYLCGCGRGRIEEAEAVEASATRAVYHIVNMDCPVEEALIRKCLSGMSGIKGLSFNLMQRVLTVDHGLPSDAPIEEALRAIDMAPEPTGTKLKEAASEDSHEDDGQNAEKNYWRRLAVACIFAVASECVEFANEWGVITRMEWLPMLLAVIAIITAGFSTYKKGWIAVRNLNLNINALMSVAVTGAVMIKQYPEAAMVMVLFNVAEVIEAKALNRARNAIRNLLSLAPEKATVRRDDGSWSETDIRDITLGSRVRVRPGERVALDGLIVHGQSSVNQAPITGESMPVEKNIGDNVFAGTINESGSFEFEVTAAADNSMLARIIHTVEESQGSRAPIQSFIDRFAGIYTPFIFLTALLVGTVPPFFMGGAWVDWIYTSLVILVIGCPCAFVISTPVSVVSGMTAAARRGILIKGGMFLERGRLLKYIAFDKTGTITKGKLSQTDFVQIGKLGAADITSLAASVAGRSDHPVSRAIAESAVEKNVVLKNVEDFTAIPGQGVSGVIDGMKWRLGNRRMMEGMKNYSSETEKLIAGLEKEGKSVVALMNDEGVQALFAAADTLKESSIAAIRELKKLGVKTMMLTGDNEYTAQTISGQVGVDSFRGNLLPEDKLDAVRKLAELGKTGMVGDGINDAPAMAGADISFAMAAAGTDTAIETADVALMDDDLRKIPRFIRISRSTYAILTQNITLALGIKAVFLTMTLMGHATMWMAVIADVGASLAVVGNALRALRK